MPTNVEFTEFLAYLLSAINLSSPLLMDCAVAVTGRSIIGLLGKFASSKCLKLKTSSVDDNIPYFVRSVEMLGGMDSKLY